MANLLIKKKTARLTAAAVSVILGYMAACQSSPGALTVYGAQTDVKEHDGSRPQSGEELYEQYLEMLDYMPDVMDYQSYLQEEPEKNPEDTYVIDAEDYTGLLSMEARLEENYNGMEGKCLITPARGAVEYTVDIRESGYYELSLTYYPCEGGTDSVCRAFLVDGEIPYEQLALVELPRVWKNESDTWSVDNQGNDLRPVQVEAPQWMTAAITDAEGYYAKPLLLYLEEGEHVLTILSRKEEMALRRITLAAAETQVSYQEKLSQWEAKGASPYTGETIVVEAESASRKSSQMLYPSQDQSSPALTPYSAKYLKNNTIGGNSWKSPGQWIEWDVEVDTPGLYELGLHVRQNFVKGTYVSRKILIDGELPFEEFGSYGFVYSQNWRQEVLSDEEGNPYRIYLEAGVHTIRMEVVLGGLGSVIRQVEDALADLNRIYCTVIRVTGVSPDTYRDYQIERSIPGLAEEMTAAREKLDAAIEELREIAGKQGDKETVLLTMRDQLDQIAKDTELVSKVISSFKTNVSAVGNWLISIIDQPLQLDTLYLNAPGQALPKLNNSWFDSAGHELKKLFYSFVIDYSQIGNVAEEEEGSSITVWVGTGRDQANVIKALLEDSFTHDTGISVNVQLVNMTTLLQATLAGQGPDVALQVAIDIPMNYGLRNAVYNLKEFEDYDEVCERFYDSALEPYCFEEYSFGLPETQTFPMMFYRKDILYELGLEVPETWEEMVVALQVLAENQMELGMLANEQNFSMFLYQHGGTYYTEQKDRSALDTTEAMDAFVDFCDYYTKYKLDKETSVEQRFRTGECPIIIADYSTYNNLQVSAPDIKGLWGFTSVPGIEREDKTIDKTVLSTGTACVIMNQTEKPDAAWEFLKWWTSADVQTSFGQEMESLMGAAARYPTANREAFANLPWTTQDYEKIEDAFAYVKGTPQVPGGYYTWRNVNNAFYRVTTDSRAPRETLTDFIRYINAEIDNKRAEFGLPLADSTQEESTQGCREESDGYDGK